MPVIDSVSRVDQTSSDIVWVGLEVVSVECASVTED